MTAHADTLRRVRSLIIQMYGRNLDGSERGPLVNAFYLAQIRDAVREPASAAEPSACGGICAEAIDLRARLVNIYHLTLTGGDPALSLLAVRDASSPGASAPAREYSGEYDRALKRIAELEERVAMFDRSLSLDFRAVIELANRLEGELRKAGAEIAQIAVAKEMARAAEAPPAGGSHA